MFAPSVKRLMRLLRRDKDLVGVAREIGQECDSRFVFADDPPAIYLFGFDDLLKNRAPMLIEISLADPRLILDSLEDEVGGVNLTVQTTRAIPCAGRLR